MPSHPKKEGTHTVLSHFPLKVLKGQYHEMEKEGAGRKKRTPD